MSERLRAILSLRYDHVEKDLFRTNTVATPIFGGTNFSDDWDFVSPMLTLEFEAAENVLLYASTGYVFKPGGFSAFANLPTPGLAQYEEEKNWASEIGLKARSDDGRLRGRAAAFYYDIEDYQVERVVTNPTFDYVILNAEEATSYGLELELEYDFCRSVTLDGSIGLTHTELETYRDTTSPFLLDGNDAPFVPDYDFVLGATWAAENGVFARLEYRGIGDTTFDDRNRPAFEQGAYGILNAQVGYRRDNFTVAVFGSNLNDQNYYTNINPGLALGAGGGATGEPRQIGVKATIEF